MPPSPGARPFPTSLPSGIRFDELLGRMRARLRLPGSDEPQVLTVGDLRLDISTRHRAGQGPRRQGPDGGVCGVRALPAPHGVGQAGGLTNRSGAGDLDVVIYSARKWARLAIAGNPTVLLLLFVPDSDVVYRDEIGAEVTANEHRCVSRLAANRFLGYLQRRRQR